MKYWKTKWNAEWMNEGRNERNEMKWEWNEMKMTWKMKWYELTWTWDKCMNQWNLPTLSYKKSRRPQCLTIFMWNRALPTVLCTCCRPHLPKVLQASEFFTIFMWNRALCRPHLPKDVRTPQSFTIVIWNRALASVLCTFCRQLLPIEARTSRNRDPTSAITEATLPEKNTGFPFPRVFSTLNSCVPDLLHFPTTWWRWRWRLRWRWRWWWWWWKWWRNDDDGDIDDIDDVVDMTMWLTWWCGCHDGEKAGHDNRP